MRNRILLQPAFVLHSRPFRDSSLLVELFSADYGRLTVIVRGARSRKSRLKGLLQPFSPLVVSWSGKGELPTVSKVEAAELPYILSGRILLCGLYINELLVKCLHRHDPHPELYRYYQLTLQRLAGGAKVESILRYFEKNLLQEIGYGLQLTQTATGDPIIADNHYHYILEHGFIICSEEANNSFSGKTLLALQTEQVTATEDRIEAKRLLRMILHHVLGDRTIKSRELFI